MSESFAELFEESLNTIEMSPGSIVMGTVIDIEEDWIIVHAGLKSEGVIPKSQFLDEEGNCDLNIGDQVKVAMEIVDDGFGETRLSREKARRAESWSALEDASETGEIITGIINVHRQKPLQNGLVGGPVGFQRSDLISQGLGPRGALCHGFG